MAKKIDDAVLDELLKGGERPEDLMADGGLMMEPRRALMRRMLGAELSEDGTFAIEVPRDREGSFEPRLVAKGQTRIDGLDEKIIAMYARGMVTVRPDRYPFQRHGSRSSTLMIL